MQAHIHRAPQWGVLIKWLEEDTLEQADTKCFQLCRKILWVNGIASSAINELIRRVEVDTNFLLFNLETLNGFLWASIGIYRHLQASTVGIIGLLWQFTFRWNLPLMDIPLFSLSKTMSKGRWTTTRCTWSTTLLWVVATHQCDRLIDIRRLCSRASGEASRNSGNFLLKNTFLVGKLYRFLLMPSSWWRRWESLHWPKSIRWVLSEEDFLLEHRINYHHQLIARLKNVSNKLECSWAFQAFSWYRFTGNKLPDIWQITRLVFLESSLLNSLIFENLG